MEGSKIGECSSPLTTSEDIQKRLVRPSSLHSQPSSSCSASPRFDEINCRNSLDVNSELQKKIREIPRLDDINRRNSPKLDVNSELHKKIKRLEDYLDPNLLSTIRAKIGGKRKNYGLEMKTAKSEVNDFDWFDWQGDHHELMTSSRSSRVSDSESSRVKLYDDKTDYLDLNLDSDSAVDGASDRERFYCTEFQRFERAAMKRFKH